MNHKSPVRIVLADDHEIFRDGFRVMIRKQPEFSLVGEGENGEELLQLVEKKSPHIVITDIQMPGVDGIEATRILHEKYPRLGVIALTMFEDDSLIIDMLEAGARGYLLKNSSKQEIFTAIRTVSEEGVYYCNKTNIRLARMIAESKFNPMKKKPRQEFTPRELEVIRQICEEKSNKEIAEFMELSVRTIESYREKIQEKMEVRNAAGIVVYAIRNGLYKV